MKKLFLLTLTLFLFGCDLVEQDTRLICNCDYVYSDFERSECNTSAYGVNNKSLVFNQSEKKFIFDGFSFPADYTKFTSDRISFAFDSSINKVYAGFNRVSLVYSESKQRADEIFTNSDGNETPTWNPTVNTFYNCELTDGV